MTQWPSHSWNERREALADHSEKKIKKLDAIVSNVAHSAFVKHQKESKQQTS